jgi:hypothetical protein
VPLSGISDAALWSALDSFTFAIGKVAHTYYDEIYECPYAAPATCYKLYDASSGLAYIEPMYTKISNKET